jgi:hypothetical protein
MRHVPPVGTRQCIGGEAKGALARPRGRTKTRAIPNATERATKANKAVGMVISCELCEGSHDLSSCPDQDIVVGAHIANMDVVPRHRRFSDTAPFDHHPEI